MEKNKPSKEWRTVPILPCISIEETLAFWQSLGFSVTYKQTHPYQYGVVMRGDYALHFGRIKGLEAGNNFYTGCLILVSDAETVYHMFTQKLKQHYGKVSHTGIPRISRMKPRSTRFTLTDVAGNSIIVVGSGEQDQKEWENADNKNQSRLQKAIAVAKRFRDYKNDDLAAAKTLDAALKENDNDSRLDLAYALMMRIELADFMQDPLRADECRLRLSKTELTEHELLTLEQKHKTTNENEV